MLFSLAAFALLSAACEGPGLTKIDDATLPVLLLGSDPLPENEADIPLVSVMTEQTVTIPDAPKVKLAIDRKVPWAQVKAIISEMESRGQEPVLLVAKRRKVQAFHLSDQLDGPIVEVYATTEGKICVHHPDAREAKCSQGQDRKYIDAVYVRTLVREAVDGYKRTNFEVSLPNSLTWGDAVAAIGGTRSCCGERLIRVQVRR
ncbi:MAG: hypothetical protein AAGC55_16320 [Myxococcota bacterium]